MNVNRVIVKKKLSDFGIVIIRFFINQVFSQSDNSLLLDGFSQKRQLGKFRKIYFSNNVIRLAALIKIFTLKTDLCLILFWDVWDQEGPSFTLPYSLQETYRSMISLKLSTFIATKAIWKIGAEISENGA